MKPFKPLFKIREEAYLEWAEKSGYTSKEDLDKYRKAFYMGWSMCDLEHRDVADIRELSSLSSRDTEEEKRFKELQEKYLEC